jgi:ABC-type transport system involved in multi-copper enzyme maturation permease subunit
MTSGESAEVHLRENPPLFHHERVAMIAALILKEFRAMLTGPKFAATFAVCSVLILLSVFVGVREYRTAVSQYEGAVQLAEQSLRTQASWMGLTTTTYRAPDPMQIFVPGVNNDIGRLSGINASEDVKLKNSAYADEPIYALFRSIDFSFIVQVVLSLFAILFTYDAINGEREGGTLQLTFSNPVPRSTYILAKLAGSWLGLVVPLLVPVLLAVLVVMLYGIPLGADYWARFGMFLIVSVLHFTFFIALGVLISTLTQRPATSFLLSLASWVTLVLIVPRLGVMAAGVADPVPSVAETEARIDAFAKDRWDQQMKQMEARWQTRQEEMKGMTTEQRKAYEQDREKQWANEDEAGRTTVQKDIDAYGVRVNEELRNRKAHQEHLAFALSRVSPASAYQLASMSLAGTGVSLKSRYEDAMRTYRNGFIEYVGRKQKETGTQGGFRITVDSQTGFHFSAPRERGTLDVSDLPAFLPPAVPFGETAETAVIDAGLLALYSLLAFAGAFLAFLRYDVR